MSRNRQERKVEMYIVNKILMRRSQLQPVTTNVAAGGEYNGDEDENNI